MRHCHFLLLFVLCLIGNAQNPAELSFSQLKRLYDESKFDSIIQLDMDELIKSDQAKTGRILDIYANTYEAMNRDDKAFDIFKKAKEHYLAANDLEQVAKINSNIYNLLDSKKNLDVDKTPYLKDLKKYAFESNSRKWIMRYYNLKGIENFKADTKDSAKYYFKKSKEIAIELDSLRAKYKLDINLGALFVNEYQMPDSAVYYYKSALQGFQNDKKEGKRKNELFAIYNNTGNAYRNQEEYQKALDYYQKAEDLDLDRYNNVSKRILYNNMEVNYYYMNDFENAYNYLYMYDSINEIIEQKKQNTNIKDIEEKYQNEKLRADNLEIEAKRIKNRNIALVLGGSILLGSVILWLAYKNRKRKQEIFRQIQEVKTQKLTNQLKEQELKSIDAMIEGQEKERLRIANELHDDLGSLMATIKYHFGYLSKQNSDVLYQKTNKLIEQAYEKIRNIAHAKNSGVLAKEGLYKAIKHLADNYSASKKIKINVYENGLDQRLENSVELTLFRIVQELITNVIKHAKASEIDIHLNEYDDHLTIMVEDNGVGFNPDQITKTNPGMGLNSIDKRVELLNGKMIIESQKESGTSIIIEIPI